jgi:2,3-bisphosphoglycerate-independent phosphoglycerate mutase
MMGVIFGEEIMAHRRCLLIITDGIGHNPSDENNAFAQANKPTYERLFATVPHALIKTSGLAVGLPEAQMGNSEVGHMTIGCGRVLYQNLVKISMAIEDGTLAQSPILRGLFASSADIHIIALASDGGVHSHIDHIKALARIAAKAGKSVKLHDITDGRDVSPTSGAGFIEELLGICDERISLATISGRFWAMDRDNRWERVERAYRVIVEGASSSELSPAEYVKSQYAQNITDEFLEPASFGGYAGIRDGDGALFANFRNDRMRELVRAVGMDGFTQFERAQKRVNIVTICEYDKSFPYPILFPSDNPTDTLADVIAAEGREQFHTAETEKYAHVTFFLNGGRETPVLGETRLLVPSPKVKTYDLKPEMSAAEVGDAVLSAIAHGYDFVVVNFANGDMVGHTGDLAAATKAVEAVDRELGRIWDAAKGAGYGIVLTSDHGNCEAMGSPTDPLTNHTTYDVYCWVDAVDVDEVRQGSLANIAATVLGIMGIDKPAVMDEALI